MGKTGLAFNQEHGTALGVGGLFHFFDLLGQEAWVSIWVFRFFGTFCLERAQKMGFPD
jgi:hypothetical protein